MKVVRGDLLELACEGHFDAIIHGCNCFHTMRSGIAGQIMKKFPTAYTVDVHSTKYGDIKKLGTYSFAAIQTCYGQAGRPPVELATPFVIINAYTQFSFGSGKLHADYGAINKVTNQIGHDFYGKRIGYPKIGAGLGGGDWDKIAKILELNFSNLDHTLVEYDGK